MYDFNTMAQLSCGNPGAFNFLMQINQHPDKETIQKGLSNCDSIRGTNIYVLCKDICGGNLSKVAKLFDKCPKDILEDACSRQDYSGRELVKKYV